MRLKWLKWRGVLMEMLKWRRFSQEIGGSWVSARDGKSDTTGLWCASADFDPRGHVWLVAYIALLFLFSCGEVRFRFGGD